MNPERILEIANNPEVPKFIFGSPALEEWTRKHRDPLTCEALDDSGFYVVVHPSLNPRQRPDLRVLSRWRWSRRMPDSWDVPATEPSLG